MMKTRIQWVLAVFWICILIVQPTNGAEKLPTGSARAFYNIAHMANTVTKVERVLSDGANALAIDVQFSAEGRPVRAIHGVPCCFLNCVESDAFSYLLKYLRDLTIPEHPMYVSQLALLFLQLRVDQMSEDELIIAGEKLAEALLVYLFDGGYSGTNAWVVLSVPSGSHAILFKGVRDTINNLALPAVLDRIGYAIGSNMNLMSYRETLEAVGVRDHIWIGDGASNCMIRTTSRLQTLGEERDLGDAYFDKVYHYIVDSPPSMRDSLRLGADAVITNRPDRLFTVMEEDEFFGVFRLATADDRPWEKQLEDYDLELANIFTNPEASLDPPADETALSGDDLSDATGTEGDSGVAGTLVEDVGISLGDTDTKAADEGTSGRNCDTVKTDEVTEPPLGLNEMLDLLEGDKNKEAENSNPPSDTPKTESTSTSSSSLLKDDEKKESLSLEELLSNEGKSSKGRNSNLKVLEDLLKDIQSSKTESSSNVKATEKFWDQSNERSYKSINDFISDINRNNAKPDNSVAMTPALLNFLIEYLTVPETTTPPTTVAPSIPSDTLLTLMNILAPTSSPTIPIDILTKLTAPSYSYNPAILSDVIPLLTGSSYSSPNRISQEALRAVIQAYSNTGTGIPLNVLEVLAGKNTPTLNSGISTDFLRRFQSPSTSSGIPLDLIIALTQAKTSFDNSGLRRDLLKTLIDLKSQPKADSQVEALKKIFSSITKSDSEKSSKTSSSESKSSSSKSSANTKIRGRQSTISRRPDTVKSQKAQSGKTTDSKDQTKQASQLVGVGVPPPNEPPSTVVMADFGPRGVNWKVLQHSPAPSPSGLFVHPGQFPGPFVNPGQFPGPFQKQQAAGTTKQATNTKNNQKSPSESVKQIASGFMPVNPLLPPWFNQGRPPLNPLLMGNGFPPFPINKPPQLPFVPRPPMGVGLAGIAGTLTLPQHPKPTSVNLNVHIPVPLSPPLNNNYNAKYPSQDKPCITDSDVLQSASPTYQRPSGASQAVPGRPTQYNNPANSYSYNPTIAKYPTGKGNPHSYYTYLTNTPAEMPSPFKPPRPIHETHQPLRPSSQYHPPSHGPRPQVNPSNPNFPSNSHQTQPTSPNQHPHHPSSPFAQQTQPSPLNQHPHHPSPPTGFDQQPPPNPPESPFKPEAFLEDFFPPGIPASHIPIFDEFGFQEDKKSASNSSKSGSKNNNTKTEEKPSHSIASDIDDSELIEIFGDSLKFTATAPTSEDTEVGKEVSHFVKENLEFSLNSQVNESLHVESKEPKEISIKDVFKDDLKASVKKKPEDEIDSPSDTKASIKDVEDSKLLLDESAKTDDKTKSSSSVSREIVEKILAEILEDKFQTGQLVLSTTPPLGKDIISSDLLGDVAFTLPKKETILTPDTPKKLNFDEASQITSTSSKPILEIESSLPLPLKLEESLLLLDELNINENINTEKSTEQSTTSLESFLSLGEASSLSTKTASTSTIATSTTTKSDVGKARMNHARKPQSIGNEDENVESKSPSSLPRRGTRPSTSRPIASHHRFTLGNRGGRRGYSLRDDNWRSARERARMAEELRMMKHLANLKEETRPAAQQGVHVTVIGDNPIVYLDRPSSDVKHPLHREPKEPTSSLRDEAKSFKSPEKVEVTSANAMPHNVEPFPKFEDSGTHGLKQETSGQNEQKLKNTEQHTTNSNSYLDLSLDEPKLSSLKENENSPTTQHQHSNAAEMEDFNLSLTPKNLIKETSTSSLLNDFELDFNDEKQTSSSLNSSQNSALGANSQLDNLSSELNKSSAEDTSHSKFFLPPNANSFFLRPSIPSNSPSLLSQRPGNKPLSEISEDITINKPSDAFRPIFQRPSKLPPSKPSSDLLDSFSVLEESPKDISSDVTISRPSLANRPSPNKRPHSTITISKPSEAFVDVDKPQLHLKPAFQDISISRPSQVHQSAEINDRPAFQGISISRPSQAFQSSEINDKPASGNLFSVLGPPSMKEDTQKNPGPIQTDLFLDIDDIRQTPKPPSRNPSSPARIINIHLSSETASPVASPQFNHLNSAKQTTTICPCFGDDAQYKDHETNTPHRGRKIPTPDGEKLAFQNPSSPPEQTSDLPRDANIQDSHDFKQTLESGKSVSSQSEASSNFDRKNNEPIDLVSSREPKKPERSNNQPTTTKITVAKLPVTTSKNEELFFQNPSAFLEETSDVVTPENIHSLKESAESDKFHVDPSLDLYHKDNPIPELIFEKPEKSSNQPPSAKASAANPDLTIKKQLEDIGYTVTKSSQEIFLSEPTTQENKVIRILPGRRNVSTSTPVELKNTPSFLTTSTKANTKDSHSILKTTEKTTTELISTSKTLEQLDLFPFDIPTETMPISSSKHENTKKDADELEILLQPDDSKSTKHIKSEKEVSGLDIATQSSTSPPMHFVTKSSPTSSIKPETFDLNKSVISEQQQAKKVQEIETPDLPLKTATIHPTADKDKKIPHLLTTKVPTISNEQEGDFLLSKLPVDEMDFLKSLQDFTESVTGIPPASSANQESGRSMPTMSTSVDTTSTEKDKHSDFLSMLSKNETDFTDPTTSIPITSSSNEQSGRSLSTLDTSMDSILTDNPEILLGVSKFYDFLSNYKSESSTDEVDISHFDKLFSSSSIPEKEHNSQSEASVNSNKVKSQEVAETTASSQVTTESDINAYLANLGIVVEKPPSSTEAESIDDSTLLTTLEGIAKELGFVDTTSSASERTETTVPFAAPTSEMSDKLKDFKLTIKPEITSSNETEKELDLFDYNKGIVNTETITKSHTESQPSEHKEDKTKTSIFSEVSKETGKELDSFDLISTETTMLSKPTSEVYLFSDLEHTVRSSNSNNQESVKPEVITKEQTETSSQKEPNFEINTDSTIPDRMKTDSPHQGTNITNIEKEITSKGFTHNKDFDVSMTPPSTVTMNVSEKTKNSRDRENPSGPSTKHKDTHAPANDTPLTKSPLSISFIDNEPILTSDDDSKKLEDTNLGSLNDKNKLLDSLVKNESSSLKLLPSSDELEGSTQINSNLLTSVLTATEAIAVPSLQSSSKESNFSATTAPSIRFKNEEPRLINIWNTNLTDFVVVPENESDYVAYFYEYDTEDEPLEEVKLSGHNDDIPLNLKIPSREATKTLANKAKLSSVITATVRPSSHFNYSAHNNNFSKQIEIKSMATDVVDGSPCSNETTLTSESSITKHEAGGASVERQFQNFTHLLTEHSFVSQLKNISDSSFLHSQNSSEVGLSPSSPNKNRQPSSKNLPLSSTSTLSREQYGVHPVTLRRPAEGETKTKFSNPALQYFPHLFPNGGPKLQPNKTQVSLSSPSFSRPNLNNNVPSLPSLPTDVLINEQVSETIQQKRPPIHLSSANHQSSSPNTVRNIGNSAATIRGRPSPNRPASGIQHRPSGHQQVSVPKGNSARMQSNAKNHVKPKIPTPERPNSALGKRPISVNNTVLHRNPNREKLTNSFVAPSSMSNSHHFHPPSNQTRPVSPSLKIQQNIPLPATVTRSRPIPQIQKPPSTFLSSMSITQSNRNKPIGPSFSKNLTTFSNRPHISNLTHLVRPMRPSNPKDLQTHSYRPPPTHFPPAPSPNRNRSPSMPLPLTRFSPQQRPPIVNRSSVHQRRPSQSVQRPVPPHMLPSFQQFQNRSHLFKGTPNPPSPHPPRILLHPGFTIAMENVKEMKSQERFRSTHEKNVTSHTWEVERNTMKPLPLRRVLNSRTNPSMTLKGIG